MLNCSDPCDECNPKAQKIKCNISCQKNPKYNYQTCKQEKCTCSRCQSQKEIKCKLACNKKNQNCECSCEEKKEHEKIYCKVSCEKEEKPKRCEICGQLIFSDK